MCPKLRGVMPIPKFLEVRISAESWNVVLMGAQARQVISETEDEAQIWRTIYNTIIAYKAILDNLLTDYNNGCYNECPYHTIKFPIELADAVNILLPK